ncbi:hypothetical protein WBK31_09750 [Nonomuraea sp. N2-4H]|uniref:hypothetical protein n=1 Tax=Nonomuraea sp. N2-4H TaxID=3128898 RepID=UPI00324B785A
MTLARTLALTTVALATAATAAAFAPAANATAAAFAPATAATTAGTATEITASAGTSAKSWGAYYAPRRAAKALGTLTITGEDHATLPTADFVRISGKVYDNTRRSSCGWALFRITYRDGDQLPFRERWVRDCTYGSPTRFSFRQSDVYQIELKVCSEPRASRPSANCRYGGTWKTLYLSK